MTEKGKADGKSDEHTILVRTRTTSRTQPRTCAGCGEPLPTGRPGRPRKWCSDKCRSRGWALNAARRADNQPPSAPDTVVHDHVVTKSRELEPRVPTGHQWLRQLDALCAQLEDPASTLCLVNYLHTGIRERLVRALASTDSFLEHRQERMTVAQADYDEHLRAINRADDDAPDSGPQLPATPATPSADGLSRQQRRALDRQHRKRRR